MTDSLLIESLISIAAIGVMVGLAWAVFKTPSPPVTMERARERLSFDEPDFEPSSWLIDTKGRAALAEGEGGDFALVSRLGLDLVTRRYPAGALRASEINGELEIAPLDPGARRVKLAANDAAQWARKLKPAVAS